MERPEKSKRFFACRSGRNPVTRSRSPIPPPPCPAFKHAFLCVDSMAVGMRIGTGTVGDPIAITRSRCTVEMRVIDRDRGRWPAARQTATLQP
jgi:hypothetical protein